jgi:hypothetical protein
MMFDLHGRVVLVTGGNAGIAYLTIREGARPATTRSASRYGSRAWSCSLCPGVVVTSRVRANGYAVAARGAGRAQILGAGPSRPLMSVSKMTSTSIAHLHHDPPAVPIDPVIEIAVAKTFTVPLTKLATLPRRELTGDFHCVAGWSATNLHWEGVAFETFYRMIIEPSVIMARRPGW